MLGDKDNAFQLTAWNGISIVAPSSWEATVTGSNHLQFESQFTPILEIRWQKISEKASSRLVDKSIKQIENLSNTALQVVAVPAFIEKLFPGFAKHCYSWKGKEAVAVLLLYCPSCALFFLLQFLHDEKNSRHPLHDIESLSCHGIDFTREIWSIQDFRIKIPSSYTLSGYNLAPGFTKLSFAAKKDTIHLCRIAPALVRLQQQNLKEILMTLTGSTNEEITGDEISLRYKRYPPIITQIITRLRRKKPFCLAALWHDTSNDRILGVIMEGIHPIDQDIFSTICYSYEILSPKK